MKIALEDILTGGLGLVVVMLAIAGVLAWVGWMRRLGFWHFLGRHSAPLGPSRAELSYRGGLSSCRPVPAAANAGEWNMAPRRAGRPYALKMTGGTLTAAAGSSRAERRTTCSIT